ncbi:NADH:flavin oxidoreductase/NADH oxidase family protein (plasmid) [Rhodococcus opacus]|uniref:NADH:flavin oxidoreductase/NADH oxidase family protein n=1 Tax=Rhodococcus opacus TaxID=37919 RepID=UPI0034D35227
MTNPLAQPLKLPCGALLNNRIAKAAMSEKLAGPRNESTAQLEAVYRRWGESGAGLILTGNMIVDRRGMEHPGNVAIDTFEDRVALQRLARAATAGGQHTWVQLSHCGRQTPIAINPEPLAPSAVRLGTDGLFGMPRPMTEGDILENIARTARAAQVVREAGFTGVQVHAAHGYLVSQFLSPRTNLREDAWGGSLENRARFLLELVRAIRTAVGSDFPLSVKLNSSDFQKDGFTLDECKEVVRWLNDESVDLLEISGGNLEQLVMTGAPADDNGRVRVRESTKAREAYFLDYAAAVVPVATMPLMVTGGFRSRAAMEEALESTGVDVIGLGRPMCADPDLPRRLLDSTVDHVPSYEHSLADQYDQEFGRGGGAAAQRGTGVLWFNYQIVAMSEGGSPRVDLSLTEGLELYTEHDKRVTAAWEGPRYERVTTGR